MEDKPGALEYCARMNNQRMTMRDIPELMELVTAMLPAMMRNNSELLGSCVSRPTPKLCCFRLIGLL